MVRAILDGRKSQTRRKVKLPAKYAAQPTHPTYEAWHGQWQNGFVACPYGQPGDQLWVRETWMVFDLLGFDHDNPRVVIGYKASNDVRPSGVSHEDFGASNSFPCTPEQWCDWKHQIERAEVEGARWVPSIFMPRWASRITLEVTAVRVERLQDISEEDAIAEGVYHDGTWWRGGKHLVHGTDKCWPSAVRAYQGLWESINGPVSWDANPWVWVVEFKQITTNQTNEPLQPPQSR